MLCTFYYSSTYRLKRSIDRSIDRFQHIQIKVFALCHKRVNFVKIVWKKWAPLREKVTEKIFYNTEQTEHTSFNALTVEMQNRHVVLRNCRWTNKPLELVAPLASPIFDGKMWRMLKANAQKIQHTYTHIHINLYHAHHYYMYILYTDADLSSKQIDGGQQRNTKKGRYPI